MIFLGRTTKQRIVEKIRMIKLTVFGRNDSRECENAGPFGFDSAVPSDFVAVYANTGASGDNVVIGFINKNQICESGESRMYSTDSEGNEVKFYSHMFTDGTCHFGGDADFMVRFNELKKGFDQLKNDFNSHVHVTTATVGPSSTPGTIAPPTTSSSASIDSAKIEEIKTL